MKSVLTAIDVHRKNTLRFWVNSVYARLLSRPVLKVIGDSHSTAFRDLSYRCEIHHIGPATAYNLNNPSSSTDSHNKLFEIINNRRANDIFVLVFGEIDCRIHIYNRYLKQAKSVSIEQIIENTISHYAEVLNDLQKMAVRFIVCSVTPPGDQENIYGYPHYGTRQQRADITRLFNKKLVELCRESGFSYLDTYNAFKDENGFVKDEYCNDGVHLNATTLPVLAALIQKDTNIVLNRFSIKVR